MTDTENPVESWLSSAVCGSLVAQVARKRGLEFTDLADSGEISSETEAILQELHDLGITGSITAEHALSSLACLFISSDNAEAIIDSFTGILWSVLGDPKQNGAQPPEIYRKAGFAMHVALLGFFDPSIPKRVFQS